MLEYITIVVLLLVIVYQGVMNTLERAQHVKERLELSNRLISSYPTVTGVEPEQEDEPQQTFAEYQEDRALEVT